MGFLVSIVVVLILKSDIFLLCAWPDSDFEELSSSRQSIEERLVEEYKNSSYSSDTRAELDRIVQDKQCFSCSTSRTITYNSSFFHQLRWALKRTFQNLMLNPQTSVAQVIHPHYSLRIQNSSQMVKKIITVMNFKPSIVCSFQLLLPQVTAVVNYFGSSPNQVLYFRDLRKKNKCNKSRKIERINKNDQLLA